jgi:hypothetical protein
LARPELRAQHLFQIGEKDIAIGRGFDGHGRHPTTQADGAQHGEGPPVTGRALRNALATQPAPIAAGHTAYKDFPATTSFKGTGSGTLKDKISRITCNNNTNTTAALEAAYGEIKRIDQKLAVNVVMLFTDGNPNGVNATFPLRTSVDMRWGPVGDPSTILDSNPDKTDCRDTSGTKECTDMPVACSAGNKQGVITQTAGFALGSGSRGGLFKAFSSDSLPSFPSNCPSSGTAMTSQALAYIPDTDRFTNSTHGPKDNWVFQVNQQCAPTNVPIPAGNNRCKNIGALGSESVSQWTAGGSPGTNFFTAGPYAGKFRTDQANTIGAVSMNTAINEAIRIRNDANYKIRIDSIYLQGNGGDRWIATSCRWFRTSNSFRHSSINPPGPWMQPIRCTTPTKRTATTRRASTCRSWAESLPKWPHRCCGCRSSRQ